METDIQPCRRAKRPLSLALPPIRGPHGRAQSIAIYVLTRPRPLADLRPSPKVDLQIGSEGNGIMTHAIRFHETGGPEVLVWEKVDVGQPGPGEARVRHTAIGLNYVD